MMRWASHNRLRTMWSDQTSRRDRIVRPHLRRASDARVRVVSTPLLPVLLALMGCASARDSDDTSDAECVFDPVHDTSVTPDDSDRACASQGNPNYLIATCPDGRVEMDCQGDTWVMDYCFNADGRLLGFYEPGRAEGARCDCNGDHRPPTPEEVCASWTDR